MIPDYSTTLDALAEGGTMTFSPADKRFSITRELMHLEEARRNRLRPLHRPVPVSEDLGYDSRTRWRCAVCGQGGFHPDDFIDSACPQPSLPGLETA